MSVMTFGYRTRHVTAIIQNLSISKNPVNNRTNKITIILTYLKIR